LVIWPAVGLRFFSAILQVVLARFTRNSLDVTRDHWGLIVFVGIFNMAGILEGTSAPVVHGDHARQEGFDRDMEFRQGDATPSPAMSELMGWWENVKSA